MPALPTPKPLEPFEAQRLIGELWEAHADELRLYAVSHCADLDADEIVGRVFESSYRALLNGAGPSNHARGYLFAALRNELQREETLAQRYAPLDDSEEGDIVIVDDLGMERQMLADVLDEFATSDQHLLVEVLGHGRRLGEVAADVGLDAAAASRRLYKVRPKFRAKWIQRHVSMRSAPEGCRPYVDQIGQVLAGTARANAERSFWEHVDGCERCKDVVAETRCSSRSLIAMLPWAGAVIVGAGLLGKPESASAAVAGVAGPVKRPAVLRRAFSFSAPVKAVLVLVPVLVASIALASVWPKGDG